MNLLRWCLFAALAVAVALGLCFAGCLVTESGQDYLETRWRSLQNREDARLRARRWLRELERKHGDTPPESWPQADRAKRESALTTLRGLGEEP